MWCMLHLHNTGLWKDVSSLTYPWLFHCPSDVQKGHTDLDKELAPKDPTLQNMGLVPGLEPVFSMRFLSGDRAAAAIGCDVAVRLAKGFSSLVWVDIISTSIRIWPIKSLKSENTVGKAEKKKKRLHMVLHMHSPWISQMELERLSVAPGLGRDPGAAQGHGWKTWRNPNKVWSVGNSTSSSSLLWLGKKLTLGDTVTWVQELPVLSLKLLAI